MIAIVNYGMGNLGSIFNMLRKIGAEAIITSDIGAIEKADKIILPGVGAFDNAMKNLNDLGLIPVLNEKVLNQKVPVLGICLGMQLLSKGSEEGVLPGFGWVDASTVKFNFSNIDTGLKVPHMGWNTVKIYKHASIFHEMFEDPRFYFVHSYHMVCNNNDDILTTTNYGYEFCSSVWSKNVIGTQFHPEKSHKFGFKLLKNFVEWSYIC